MANRRTPLVTDEYYHVFNRGVARQPTFHTKWDYEQMLLTLAYYRFKKPAIKLSRFKELSRTRRKSYLQNLEAEGEPLVSIIAFVLMPNHFHVLLRQEGENGIATFVSNVTNSYTRYGNTKRHRVGPLFQGVFKSVHVETTEQLLHLSRYIHLNPFVSHVVGESEFVTYPWSSFPEYVKGASSLLELDPVLSHFRQPKQYQQFVLDQADYAKKLERIKHLTIEKID